MINETKITGGCACRKIRYVCTESPGFSFHCQCRSCQYLSGTGHASAFLIPVDSISIDGELKWYGRQAPNGNKVESGFCDECGSPIINRNSGYPDKLFVSAASLDDTPLFKPVKVVHHDEAAAWDVVDLDLL